MSGLLRAAGFLVLAATLPACAAPRAARVASCDGLTAAMIRATGASLAGRAGTRAVFRATDAERMSLDCRAPARMVFASRDREPERGFYELIGRAARALAGADAETAEVLARQVHQDSLLADAPRQGVAGKAALRCETGPRADALAGDLTVCVLVPNRPPALRRKAGLSREAPAG
ncbi:hypothetical protein MKK70_07015 [Methylobacterium sp. E-041]|jgi:hypothetical protein|uniref:hypothetical protein n=2 Tax=Methylobacterium TaxID=407 RepID=UPI001FB8FF02|nr:MULTISPECIES: hypothetical protein [unclassified Methylobacterium]MCJ2010486.1 hypothetical protein [Methylobacterium sp. J-092]MCJ2038590.1 hypothetical protein [Methylobacterium sp. J-059]MCJ2077932.1 hypothetical protein [Methylobacterium sp. E-016]MCJ2105134.1 hypothetical protein [Methylobacterium sp. E-041]